MIKNSEIKMGQLPEAWGNGKAKSITFCVTEDCNLACKYCYMIGKNKKNKMSFDVAKKAVDYILSDREEFDNEGVIWEFVGGEPFLEIELIDRICDYIKQQMFLSNHPWFDMYRFNFSSNGVLYNTPKVQEYIKKNKGHLSIGISIDGNRIKHDLQRVKPDGTGSYDDVVRNVPLWQKQFPGFSTKATFTHEDLPHLKDSIVSLWDIGINMVSANIVFEDVWHEGDDDIFELQLRELGDYVLENGMWKDYSVRFFDPHIGFPLITEDLYRNFCGSGKMLAIDCHGNFYPCVRFYDISLNNRKGYIIGDVYNGINKDRLRPFEALTLAAQSSEKCIKCEVASGCAWCTGCNYDMADTETIYQRATFLCKMHKANVRAAEYFWDKFSKTTGLVSPRDEERSIRLGVPVKKYLYFITSDDIMPHCSYRNIKNTHKKMSREIIDAGLEFARRNGFTPVFIGKTDHQDLMDSNEYLSIIDAKSERLPKNSVAVYDNCDNSLTMPSENCILLVNKNNIGRISSFAINIFQSCKRINLILEEIEEWNGGDVELYKVQLEKLVGFIADKYKENIRIELNILTDILGYESMHNCDAGNYSFALAPNGKFYMCPAFYFDNQGSFIGTPENGIEIKNKHLLELKNAPICSNCDVYHCRRCKYLNMKLTTELNTPSRIQCVVSHVERNKARELQILLVKHKLIDPAKIIEEIDYLDPLEKIIKKEQGA